MENVQHVDENFNIKKGDLIKDSLREAPVLPKKQVIEELTKFIQKNVRNADYILLNARDINYIQVFDITNSKNANKIASHIYSYFEDSSFCTAEDKPGLIPAQDIEHHQMTNIKDIDVESKTELGLYIDTIYFKLVMDNWMVEIIK